MNEEICEELGQVRDSLNHVAGAISNLVPKGELDRASEAVVEDNRRWRRSVVLLIIGGPVLFLLNLGVLWQARHNETVFKKDIRQGISCMLGEESTHRRDSRTFETDVAAKLGIPNYPGKLHAETTVPSDDLDVLTRRCVPILRRFADKDLGSQGAYYLGGD